MNIINLITISFYKLIKVNTNKKISGDLLI